MQSIHNSSDDSQLFASFMGTYLAETIFFLCIGLEIMLQSLKMLCHIHDYFKANNTYKNILFLQANGITS